MKRGGGLARALLVALLALSPWGFDDAASSSRGDAASSDGREAAGLIRFRPRTSSSSSSSSSSTLFALAAHDDVYSGGIITVDSRGNPVGDTVSAPARSMVGFVQDCVGIPPKNSGSLCGARGSYLHGHYLFVAATLQNAVTCVDVYRPDMPTIAGSVADRVNLEQVVATWMHRSEDYLVAVSRGKRPAGIGSVTLVDVRPARWSVDSSDRPIVSPVVLTSLKNCSSTTTVDGVRTTTGSLCGARAFAVKNDFAYVVGELSNSVVVVALPNALSDDPSLDAPVVRGFVNDQDMLKGAYAIAVSGTNAFVASRWDSDAIVLIDVLDPSNPTIGGKVPKVGQLGSFDTVVSMSEIQAASYTGSRLRGLEFVAKGVPAGSPYAFVTSEFDGRVSTVDARCVAASEEVGESVGYCASSARRALYDVDSPADEPYVYRSNARPNRALL